MDKFTVQIALEGVAEASAKWRKARMQFDRDKGKVLRRLLFEAAANYMSAEEFAKAGNFPVRTVREMMRKAGLSTNLGKQMLADTAAKALAENSELLGIAPHEMDLMSPLAYLPMGDALRKELIEDKTVSQVTELPDEDEAFYAEHYSDWTVHKLPVTIYVPLGRSEDGPEHALALVREILDQAAFDIRVSGNNQ